MSLFLTIPELKKVKSKNNNKIIRLERTKVLSVHCDPGHWPFLKITSISDLVEFPPERLDCFWLPMEMTIHL